MKIKSLSQIHPKNCSEKWSHDGAANLDCETFYYGQFPLYTVPIKNVSAKVCSVVVTLRNTQEGRKCLVKLLLNYSKAVTGFVLPSFTE